MQYNDNLVMEKRDTKTFGVIIAGSRKFTDINEMTKVCDFMLSNKIMNGYKITVISGTAKGADTTGETYACSRGFEVKRMPADWDRLGKRAGYIRNTDMANCALDDFDECGCIIFRINQSKGSTHMYEICQAKHIPCCLKDYTI